MLANVVKRFLNSPTLIDQLTYWFSHTSYVSAFVQHVWTWLFFYGTQATLPAMFGGVESIAFFRDRDA